MNDTKVVKATGIADFLGSVPALLGHYPEDALVLVPMLGGRSVGAMRFDEECVSDPEKVIDLASRVACDGFVFVLYTNEQIYDGRLYEIIALTERAEAEQYRVYDAAIVSSATYRSVADAWVPHPISEIPAPPMPVTGTRLPGRPTLPEGLESLIPGWDVDLEMDADELVGRIDGFASRGPVLTEEYNFFRHVFIRPAVRDIALIHWVTGQGALAVTAQILWENGVPYPQALADVVLGKAPRPDAERLNRLLERTLVVCAATPDDGGPWAVAAWLCWALGRSSAAEQYAKWGLEADPGHGMCEIVLAFVEAAHLPEWAFTA